MTHSPVQVGNTKCLRKIALFPFSLGFSAEHLRRRTCTDQRKKRRKISLFRAGRGKRYRSLILYDLGPIESMHMCSTMCIRTRRPADRPLPHSNAEKMHELKSKKRKERPAGNKKTVEYLTFADKLFSIEKSKIKCQCKF